MNHHYEELYPKFVPKHLQAASWVVRVSKSKKKKVKKMVLK